MCWWKDVLSEQNYPFVWAVCTENSTGFYGEFLQYNKSSFIITSKYNTLQQGLLGKKLKLMSVLQVRVRDLIRESAAVNLISNITVHLT